MTTDGEEDGTSRRRFLGAAAAAVGFTGALGTASATPASDRPDVEVEHGDTGVVRGSLPNRGSNGAFLELYNPNDGEATVGAKAWHIPDEREDSHVALGVSMEAGRLSVNLTPEEARTIAADLEAAADHAEGEYGD